MGRARGLAGSTRPNPKNFRRTRTRPEYSRVESNTTCLTQIFLTFSAKLIY
ncbi:hypothetical protein Hanom_Chr12g01109491 [Helianthus anomalus]